MPVLTLLAASVALYIVGAAGSLLLWRSDAAASWVAGVMSSVAAVLGVAASLQVLIDGAGPSFAATGPMPFASFLIRVDPLAALLVLIISLVTLAASIFSLSYLHDYAGRGIGVMGFFYNLFVAAMMMVAVADNGFYFLLFWELMTLTSYFLVIFDQDRKAVDAGFLYFFITQSFSMALMAAFLLMFMRTGSLDFAAFRAERLPSWLASIIFVLIFFGFGAKAGMVPLHIWLPRAHPAAPSHASALMSGVMVKLGIYGIIRVGVDILGASVAWWGWIVLAFGAVSSVLGVLYALAEHDIKRLLAYHTVENIGIILMGTGVGMVGIATGRPVVASIGLLAAFYHTLNHSLFKGLLFLGAGAATYATHTRNMMQMGGLARRMGWTASFFLVGALSIAAIPPLNGFVSEWFTYQAFFAAGIGPDFSSRLFGPLAAVTLALTGALAVMCFVKAWGMMFGGAARSPAAAEAEEVPATMLAGMTLLAVLCVLTGFGAPAVAPVLSRAVATLLKSGMVPVADGLLIFPGDAHQAVLSTPLMALLLLGLLAVPLVISLVHRGHRVAPRIVPEAWACGYDHDAQMTVSASGFVEPPGVMLRGLYWLRKSQGPVGEALDALVDVSTEAAGIVEPVWDETTVGIATRGVAFLGRHLQAMEGGNLRVYCLYILAALGVLLIVVAR
jgi:hydrogenase-4 component B